MEQKYILYPLLAMALLTFMVAVTMFKRRVAFMKAHRLHPQKVATSSKMSAAIEDTRASDNFRNLFEMPVLFYAAIITIFVTGQTSTLLLLLSWAFVAGRYAHSIIQCTNNIVMVRFYAYLTSMFMLFGMWLMIAYNLILA